MTRWRNLSRKQARELGIEGEYELMGMEKNEPRKSRKYNNKKPEIDGITFDSQKESRFYEKLKMLKESGVIKDFELQPEFVLLEPGQDQVTGRGIKYRADFKIIYTDGKEEIIDVKGYKTSVYKLKKKLLLARHPDINFREV